MSTAPVPAASGVTVAYRGGAERRGPVTMGQANMIRCILRDDPTHINNHDVWPVPPGTSLDAVVDALRALVVRHEALRTTFPPGPDPVPHEQVVSAEGEFTLAVLDHAHFPPEPARYAESVARGARAGRFRLDREFPLRITLLTLDGAPAYLTLASSHAVTDSSALAVLRGEFHALVSGAELPALTALAPLDLAAAENTPTGQRKSQASLRYWERVLRTAPQAMFAEPRARATDGRVPQLTLRSRQGARALAEAARRTGSPASTVLLTAWCTLVAHRAGQTSCVAAAPTSNRFLPRLARSVNTLSQDALLHLDVRGPSFDVVLRKAWGAALDAYRHSQFDALRLWEMIGEVTRERGSHFARDVVFNDVSAVPGAPAPATAGEAAQPDLELAWGPVQVLPTRLLTFAYRLDPVLHVALWADPALFTPEEAQGFLGGLVRLLEAAAAQDVPLASLTAVTGVQPAARPAHWTRVDHCWVSPPAVADALSRALGGLPVHVGAHRPAGDGDGPVLTAFIAAGGSALTPEAAHAALVDLLPGRPELLAPQRYVIVQDPPAQTGRSSAWLRQQILGEGNGRERQMRHDH
ncbi:condensation domain-containing protein [Streptomyces sp. cmx-4-9]|uniref:condensation domain-containing protein n=1 Tax=Streptomyces sp. cmx-4-9 TaxID=2790941 RepID=UPI00397F00F4